VRASADKVAAHPAKSNHVAAENSFDEARNIIQDVVTGVGDLWQEYSTGCMYGKNCGEKCDLVDPEGIDDLDRSCYLHDCCLSMSTKVSAGLFGVAACYCERELIANAQFVIDDEGKCGALDLLCFDTEKVQAAKSIVTVMTARLKILQEKGDCGDTPSTYTNFVGDVCPSPSPTPSPTPSPAEDPMKTILIALLALACACGDDTSDTKKTPPYTFLPL